MSEKLWKIIKDNVNSDQVPNVLKEIREKALHTKLSTNIKFGTSGWRSIIGYDFSIYNLKIAVQAIINVMHTPIFLKESNMVNFREVQHKGILVGRDTRFMGEDFVKATCDVLMRNNIDTYVVERPAITPDLSLAVATQGFSGSINLTPSHNPYEYSGLKFNPADGGPATQEITDAIEIEVAKIFNGFGNFPENSSTIQKENILHKFDSLAFYKKGLENHKILDLKFIKDNFNPEKLTFIEDNVYGATYGYLKSILERDDFSSLRNLPDVLFGGVQPEPSSANMQLLIGELKKHHTPLKLGVIFDPDGDRVRFTDGVVEIDMNQFGAIAFHYLAHRRGINGGIVKSVATSNFVNSIAQGLKRPIYETAVGFKNFRQYLKSNEAVCAFEESDGITLKSHTLEKDGVIGALLALEIILRTGKNLSVYLREIQQLYGFFYPQRFSQQISLEQKEKLPKLLKSYQIGEILSNHKIVDIINIDGFKCVLDDQSWLMIRPSGTEPKVRIYVEARLPSDTSKLFSVAQNMLNG